MNVTEEQKRFNMIEQQIRTWGVLDPIILELLTKIHREKYVPLPYRGLAFADISIPIHHGETMLAPRQEAKILQALNLNKNDIVLHVGTGSGYFVALLAALSKSVITMDIYEDLILRAKQIHIDNNIKNIDYLHDDGVLGYAEKAPYDVIVLTGAVAQEPISLRKQLSIGGKLFLFEGVAPIMSAKLIHKVGFNEYKTGYLFEDVIPSLYLNHQPSSFIF